MSRSGCELRWAANPKYKEKERLGFHLPLSSFLVNSYGGGGDFGFFFLLLLHIHSSLLEHREAKSQRRWLCCAAE